ncbi:MAG: T9SS type A sorting domain-containing protein, partial [Prevotella sp.]|nr:T9SS type A sorting domain-containing protein [Prevotella sp.]
VANKDNVNIVAMLINGETGEIMNADKVKPQVGTAINAVSSDGDINIYVVQRKIVTDIDGCVLVVFNTAGREVTNESLVAGVYMVKAVVGDRTVVRKIMVR